MDEVWMPFPNHPLYEVSNTGKVRRADTLRERVPVKIKNGYMTVMGSTNWSMSTALLPTPLYRTQTTFRK